MASPPPTSGQRPMSRAGLSSGSIQLPHRPQRCHLLRRRSRTWKIQAVRYLRAHADRTASTAAHWSVGPVFAGGLPGRVDGVTTNTRSRHRANPTRAEMLQEVVDQFGPRQLSPIATTFETARPTGEPGAGKQPRTMGLWAGTTKRRRQYTPQVAATTPTLCHRTTPQFVYCRNARPIWYRPYRRSRSLKR